MLYPLKNMKLHEELMDKNPNDQSILNNIEGITENIPNLLSEMVSNKAARTWLEVWQEVAGDKPELDNSFALAKNCGGIQGNEGR